MQFLGSENGKRHLQQHAHSGNQNCVEVCESEGEGKCKSELEYGCAILGGIHTLSLLHVSVSLSQTRQLVMSPTDSCVYYLQHSLSYVFEEGVPSYLKQPKE